MPMKNYRRISVSQWNHNWRLFSLWDDFRLFIFISHDLYFIFSSSWPLTLWGPTGWTTAYTQSWPLLSLFARWDDRSWEPECPLSPALMELSLSTPLLVLGKISTPMFFAVYTVSREYSKTDRAEGRRSSFLSLNAVLPCHTYPFLNHAMKLNSHVEIFLMLCCLVELN